MVLTVACVLAHALHALCAHARRLCARCALARRRRARCANLTSQSGDTMYCKYHICMVWLTMVSHTMNDVEPGSWGKE